MSARVTRFALAALAAVVAAFAPAVALAQASPSDFTTGTRYDWAHRVVGTIAPDPDGTGSIHFAAVRNSYDSDGRLVKVEKGELAAWQSEAVAPSAWSGFTVFQTVDTVYDLLDRKLTETISSGGTAYTLTQYSYDAVGRVQCTAARLNPAVYGSLPSSACTLGTAGSDGPDRITRNTYDDAGQLTVVQKAYGVTTANGFPATLQQNYATYTYTANGKQASMTDANGNKAGFTYDGFDRQTQWNFPDKVTVGTVSATDYEAYTYDADGNRLTLRKRDGSVIGYSYDALNRVLVKDIPGGTSADVYYGYDAWGRQTFARFGSTSGAGLTNVYDGLGRLASASSNLDGTARAFTYLYDADSNRTRVTHPDGNYFVYVYDGLNRPIAIQENGSTQVVAIAYDNQGRRSGDARGVALTGYAYDGVSRLNGLSHDLTGTSGDVSWTLGYNPANQITTQYRSNNAYAFTGYAAVSKTYLVNGLNQYTAADSASPTYDANGNLTSDGTTGYTYDVENRLITTSAGATLDYDPSGRLWRMTTSSATVRFFYDGDQLLEERDGSGTLLRRYVHGNDEDDPLLWYDGSGLTDRRSFQIDHQGSIVSIANADGTLRTIDSYDEYGTPGSTNDGRFQYTGQAWLPALGLYYYKARIYSPKLGRFLQTDPIGYGDQVNLYGYVGNDPADGTDPAGMFGLFGNCPAGSSCTSSDPEASNEAAGLLNPTAHQSLPANSPSSRLGAVAAGGIAGFGVGVVLAGVCDGVTVLICTPADPVIVAGTTGLGAIAGGAIYDISVHIKGAVDTVVSALHGNSARSQRSTEVYHLINVISGQIDKIGITSSGKRYTQTYLVQNGVIYQAVARYNSRYPAMVHENIELTHYFFSNGRLPRLNRVTR